MLRLLSRRVPLCKAIIYFSVEIHLTGRKDRYDIFGVSKSKGRKDFGNCKSNVQLMAQLMAYYFRLALRLLIHSSSNFTQKSIKSNTIPISSKSNPRSQSSGIIKRTALTILKMIFMYSKDFSIMKTFLWRNIDLSESVNFTRKAAMPGCIAASHTASEHRFCLVSQVGVRKAQGAHTVGCYRSSCYLYCRCR